MNRLLKSIIAFTCIAAPAMGIILYAQDQPTEPASHSHVEENHDGHDHDGHEHEEGDGHDHNHDSHKQEEAGGHDHDGHEDGHDHEAGGGHAHEEGALKFADETVEEFGIITAQAGPGVIAQQIETSGEIVPNPDLISHIVPRVSGVVREVKKTVGDRVERDELLAVLESRELATLKSNYLSALERLELAQELFSREEELWKKKISAEQDYLSAKQKLAEMKIEVHAAEQQLHAIGFSQDYVDNLPSQPDTQITRYELRAPFSGRITEKHLTLGEYVKDDSAVFTVADLSQVWAQLTLYQKDVAFVREGQQAGIHFDLAGLETVGTVSFITPMLDEHTRTATARVVVDNSSGDWRPGLFINAEIAVERRPVEILVPKTAVLTVENQAAVFIKTAEGFEAAPVKTGRSDRDGVEILSGLSPGQAYVAKGGFALKAEMDKEAFAHSGHAH